METETNPRPNIAGLGNRNAAKSDSERATALVKFRAQPRNKLRWSRAAKRAGETLSRWITRLLNSEADR